MHKILVEIISPSGKVFSGKCASVSLPGESGRFGVMHRHMNLVAKLKGGEVVLEIDHNNTKAFNIESGIAEVTPSVCNILVDSDH